ncbi:TetR/AcrR family transcriptional regulator [Candidatus Kaistella beijingensis]|uniref:TetR/AcrR family transcriptional regulator n=1 Tax=Candidatus Kaistella beijingensis TaxID=2820270 RepID=UPI001CC4828F|nr:TetR/AcrR family transcriptional regulator [Candidatus Kaistella beijingensis]UBB89715.1 TetR/AcrR family transcriptional regulator [Candidatus Kaistella beijingensis]
MSENEISTEDKILLAASKVFTEKGFAGARTRDIADEAGINLALLNYYFRSKEKLFDQVMKVKIVLLFGKIIPIISNEKTTIEEKIDLASEKYFEILSKNPNLPLFVISEIQKKNSDIKSILPVEKILMNSVIIQQIKEKNPGLNPFHFLLNFLGMTVFPFLARPVFQNFHIMNDDEFQKFVEERKTLVPQWIKLILNS